ncbi:MAG: sulfotransferase domain-containing protein [Chloroflexota bacterium]|nr:sulfotransferase domain-containing protein [Chloroflexota bacterium]
MKSSLVISVGMPRAGSGWYYNLTHDLVAASGGQDARQIRQTFHLQRLLTEVNCNIGTLSFYRLLPVMVPALLGNSYVIKLHAGPRPLAKVLIGLGMVLPTYIYRDPRDALLSAFEYGQRKREHGRGGEFSQLTSIEKAIDFMADYVRVSEAWLACEQALHIRYEDLLMGYETEAERLLAFLGIQKEAPGIGRIIDQYRPKRGRAEQKGTHFVKGKIGRHRQAFTEEQLERCVDEFGEYLERLGYPV